MNRIATSRFLVLAILLVSIVLLSDVTFVRATGPESLTRIAIYGDHGFTGSNGVIRGDGSASNPYLIEGWTFVPDGGWAGIDVRNTTAYFVIRQVEFTFGAERDEAPDGRLQYGTDIYLENVTNARVEHSSSQCHFAGGFIALFRSRKVMISENNAFGCEGIYVVSSVDVVIKGNNFNSLDNPDRFGITIGGDRGSTNVTITSNYVSNCLYCVTAHGSNVTISDNVIVSNTEDGIGVIADSSIPITGNTVMATVDIQLLGTVTHHLVYHNNLYGPLFPASAAGFSSDDPRIPTWDSGYPGGGNYWGNIQDNFWISRDNCSGAKQVDCSQPDGIADEQLVGSYVLGMRIQPARDRFPLTSPFRVLEGNLEAKPGTISSNSRGTYLTAYVELPPGFSLANVDFSTVRLNGTFRVALESPATIGDHDRNGVPDVMVKFSMTDVKTMFTRTGIYVLQVSGLTIVGGRPFVASDTVRFKSL